MRGPQVGEIATGSGAARQKDSDDEVREQTSQNEQEQETYAECADEAGLA